MYAGLVLSVSISLLLSILIYLLAPWIATDILKETRTTELLRIIVLAIVPACIHSCFNGYYYGRKNSVIPSVCQITEQLARVFGTLILYYILTEQGVALEPMHAVWGIVISELAGLFVNVTAFLGMRKECAYDMAEQTPGYENRNAACHQKYPLFHTLNNTVYFYGAARALGTMAIPLTLNHVLMTLSHSLEHLLLPQQLLTFGYTSDEALEHFGILTGMALSVIFFPSAITNSLSVLLLPRISENKAKGDMCAVLDTIKGALCCGVALGSLCTFVFLLSADWFGAHIFDNTLAGFYIRILSILCPFMYTSSLLSSIVNGLGNASLTLTCNLTGCAIRIFAIWFLVPMYGMYAYIISMIAAAVVVTIELVAVIKRKCM